MGEETIQTIIQYLALEKRAKQLEKELSEVKAKAEEVKSSKVKSSDTVDLSELKEYFKS